MIRLRTIARDAVLMGVAGTLGWAGSALASSAPDVLLKAKCVSPKPAAPPATKGSLVLEGQNNDDKVAVAIVRFVANAAPDNPADAAPSGKHIVAIEFRITNVGTTRYNDYPDNDVTLYNAAGQGWTPTPSGVALGPGFPNAQVNLAPGQTALGYEVTNVPNGQTIVRITYSPDSGTGQVGQWTV